MGGGIMKDLKQLAAACEEDLRSVGIRPGAVVCWRVNTRAKSRWGQCRELSPGRFEISIAARLLQDDVSEQAAKDTVLHELLHTVRGCGGHTGKWAELAAAVNRLLPQYTIKRTASLEEKGLPAAPRPRTDRYMVRCVRCGREFCREKQSKLIQHPEFYRCGCGGKIERVR